MAIVKIGGVEFTTKQIERMAAQGFLTLKNDPASTVPTGNVPHGQTQQPLGNVYGLFTQPGVRPEMYSALARPYSVTSILNVSRSEYNQEIIEILTGQTASAGTNPTGFCGNPAVVGNLKVCAQLTTFGKYYIKTELNAIPEVGQLKNRADIPRNILNTPVGANPFMPDIFWSLPDTRSQLRFETYRIGVDYERTLEQVAINGVQGTQNSDYIGWITQFNGLDRLIKTGYADSVTGTTCPAADSAVQTFGANISGNGVGGFSIVESLSYLVQDLQTRAGQVGMDTVEHAIVLRRDLFNVLVEYWACEYWTYNCDGSATSPNNRDGATIQQLRTDMWNGRFLYVNGQRVPVVFSDGLTRETVGANLFNSDILVVPVRWNGLPLLDFQYFPMDNLYITEFTNAFGVGTPITSAENGMWLIGQRSTGLCLEWHFAMQGRMILETPFLAGRLDNCQYSLAGRSPRDAYPGMSFYADGGMSRRSGL